MRLPRLRFSVRRMMVAVAIVAIFIRGLIEGEIRRGRSKTLREDYVSQSYRLGLFGKSPRERIAMQYRAYFKEQASKYEWASKYPWLPVAPDPPEPK